MTERGLGGRLSRLVTLGAVLTLAGLTAGFNLVLRSNLDGDADQLLKAKASAALESIAVQNGNVEVKGAAGEAGPDAEVWIFSGNRALERPPAAKELQVLADSLARGPERFTELKAEDVRLFSTAVRDDSGRAGTIVSALSLKPYERSANRALVGSIAFSLLLLTIILIATRIVLSRALAPVAQMTNEAAEWSVHDLDHRFNAGEPHDELTRLAATFDSMLERLAASIRHEKRFSAEISHELRTPLAAVSAEAELALRRKRNPEQYREALTNIAEKARVLEHILETLLMTARGEGFSRDDIADPRTAAVAAVEALKAPEGHQPEIQVEPTSPDQHLVAVAAPAVERILAPLIENAARYATNHADVSFSDRAGVVEIRIADDGPGVAPLDAERIFEPGVRGVQVERDPDSSTGSAGLGLALARRLARSAGGEIELCESQEGAAFVVRLSAAGGSTKTSSGGNGARA